MQRDENNLQKYIDEKLKEVGLTDEYVFKKIKYVMDNAVTIAEDGTMMPDFTNIMRAINAYLKLKGYGKKPVIVQIANIFRPNGYLT